MAGRYRAGFSSSAFAGALRERDTMNLAFLRIREPRRNFPDSDAGKGMSGMRSATNTLTEPKQSLAPGDRVRMSAQGRARHPKYGDRQGLLVGRGSYPSSWRVKFDERRSIQAIHQDYLEKVGRSGAGQSDSKQFHNAWEALRSKSALLGIAR